MPEAPAPEAADAPYARPLPRPTPESRPFWEACRRHELLLQHCRACGRWWHPPSAFCPNCWSDDFAWKAVAGRGRVFSWVVYGRVYHPAFREAVPYDVAVIELDEGPRLVSNVVEVDPRRLTCGLRVEVVFDDVTPDVTLPRFRPAP